MGIGYEGTRFEWDEEKAEANIVNHNGVSFFEAATVFTDPLSIIVDDDEHSIEEQRFLTVGLSRGGRVLIVSYAEREDVVRITAPAKPSRKRFEPMKKHNKTIDPLRKERQFAGKKVRRRGDIKKVVSADALEPRNIKVHISIKLDGDVLEYFKRRARQPGAPPYQTQINQVLRDVIEREGPPGGLHSELSIINPALRAIIERDQERFPGEALVQDDRFVDAIAERVKQRL